MTKREKRVIHAFTNCVKSGEFTPEYACLLIEDSSKYGYLSDEAKESFYEAIDSYEAELESPAPELEEITEGGA